MTNYSKWPEYDDTLKEPIKFPHAVLEKNLGDLDHLKKVYNLELLKNQLQKFNALFSLYGIDPESPARWWYLSCALAFRHVPGFQMEDLDKLRARESRRKPGRPSNNTKPEYKNAVCWLFRQYVEIKFRNPKLSNNNIYKIISKKKDFPQIMKRNDRPLSPRRIGEILCDIMREPVETGTNSLVQAIRESRIQRKLASRNL